MKRQTVRTREELKKAQENGTEEIIIKGELANKVKRAKTITKLSAAGLATLTAALGTSVALAPATGGLSLGFVAAPVAAMTGLEIAAIIAAATTGIALIIAVFSGYEEIKFSAGELVLRKKSSKAT